MIHEYARGATGGVLLHGEFVGHCVLIGPRLAVTCAHVLSKMPARPDEQFFVNFRNLDNRDRAAEITEWVPFDPALRAGTDIAVLTFEGADFEVATPWLSIDGIRPAADSQVVALNFTEQKWEGDVREGSVIDGKGSVISLSGDTFLSSGMSGGGLYYRLTGAALLGIISAQPETVSQTAGYAIPSDEIQKLIANSTQPTGQGEAFAANFKTLIEWAVAAVGGNHQGELEPFKESVFETLNSPPDTWIEEDLDALCDLRLALDEALKPFPGEDRPILPPGLSAAFGKVQEIMTTLGSSADGYDAPVKLTTEMIRLLREAHDDCRELIDQSSALPEVRKSVNNLANVLDAATSEDKATFGQARPHQLSNRLERARLRVGASLELIPRKIMTAIGMRADLAEPGTIFCDSLEPWAPEMVVIPACPGGFLMGSPENEPERGHNELQHQVRIPRKFALARFALTFREYDAYCSETGTEEPGDREWGREKRPVINVSWNETSAWCRWLSEKTGVAYRLPSEAEWEYACRGDATGKNETPFCPQIARAGHGEFLTSEEANFDGKRTYNGSPKGEDRQMTVAANHDGFKANGFGLVQMHGNVWEWCEDVFEEDYRLTPSDGSSHLPQPVAENARRVVRGGSWSGNPQFLRSADRFRSGPVSRDFGLGFRPARTLFTS